MTEYTRESSYETLRESDVQMLRAEVKRLNELLQEAQAEIRRLKRARTVDRSSRVQDLQPLPSEPEKNCLRLLGTE